MRARATTILNDMPNPTPMLEQFDFHFRRVLERAAQHADRVLVVRQPWFDKEFSSEEAAHMWHGGAGQVWRQDVSAYYSFDVVSRLMTLVDTKAASIADERGIEQLNLMPVLEPSLNTYYDGFHATPAGASAIAAAIGAATIRRRQPEVSPTVANDNVLSNRRTECVDLLAS